LISVVPPPTEKRTVKKIGRKLTNGYGVSCYRYSLIPLAAICCVVVGFSVCVLYICCCFHSYDIFAVNWVSFLGRFYQH
jgi:hypothetical protein